MESKPVITHSRINYSESEIKTRIADYLATGYSIKDYCYANGDIDGETLESWLQQYRPDKSSPEDETDDGFMVVNVTERKKPGPKKQQPVSAPSTTPQLFARIGDIELYQHVSAAYLKSLKS